MKPFYRLFLCIFLISSLIRAEIGVTNVSLSLTGGNTKKAFGVFNQDTTVFNYNGPLSFAPLFRGVEEPSYLTTAQKGYITALNNIPQAPSNAGVPTDSLFGFLRFNGKFSFFQAGITLEQNVRDWFVSFTLPYKKIKIEDLTYTNLGPKTGASADALNDVLDNLPGILSAYGVKMEPYTLSGLNDVTIELGRNYHTTKRFRFKEFNASIKGGLIVPTGKKAPRNLAFPLPLGNDGQVGIPLTLNAEGKIHDALSVTGAASFIFFLNQITSWRMKTNTNQNMLFLALGAAKRKIKPFADIVVAVQATPGPFTFSVGYNYMYEGTIVLYPEDPLRFNTTIVNQAQSLTSSFYSAIQASASYEGSSEKSMIVPDMSITATIPFTGNTIFNLPLVEGTMGLNFIWWF